MRLAEIVGTLSLATDAGAGMPDSHALRGATIAARFAEHLGVGDKTVGDAYYLALLALSGCVAESGVSAEVLGDEIQIGVDTYGLDTGSPSDVISAMYRAAVRDHGTIGGLVAMARAMSKMSRLKDVGRAHCEVAIHLAECFGFDEPFRAALYQSFERWDGRGKPVAVKGEAIAQAMRIAHVAIDANVGHKLGGVEGTLAILEKHSGRGLDPTLVKRFKDAAADLCAVLDAPSPWSAAMDAEPKPHRMADDKALDECLRAIANLADLKCQHTRGHSTGVADLALAAATKLGLGPDAAQALFRSGLVHDVGRVAVSAAIWDKAGPLTDAERERIRLHTYVGERVLSKAPGLAAIAEIATLAHERLDGSGYHRRLSAAACTSPSRILAAADVYQALRAARPHRAALGADEAAAELNGMAKSGSLCPDAVTAVLGAAGHAVRTPERPGGLTDREVEVLRLVARGLTNKEIASSLDISPKTAGHHVQHVLEKLHVTTRAAATMIAMKTGIAQG